MSLIGKPLPRSGQYDGVLLTLGPPPLRLRRDHGLLLERHPGAGGQSVRHRLPALAGRESSSSGWACSSLFMRMPYRAFAGRFALWALVGSVLLLVLLLLPLGLAVVVRGTRRFLNLGLLRASSRRSSRGWPSSSFWPPGARAWERSGCATIGAPWSCPSAAIGLVAGLIVLQPNLSSAALMGMLGFVLLWLAGQPLKRLAVVPRARWSAWPR